MVRHNEYLIKFLQLTDLLEVLQTFAGIRQDKVIKKDKKNVMTKLMNALLSLNPPDSRCHNFYHNRSCKRFQMLKTK